MQQIAVKQKSRQIADSVVEKFIAGDRNAFREIYDSTINYVGAIAYRMTGSVHHAEELCQEIFIKLWNKREQFRGDSSFKTWFHKLAVNTILDYCRSSAYRNQADSEQYLPDSAAVSPVEVESKIQLEQALLRLPEMERLVLIMHDVNGWKHAEIGELIGISPNTSKVHLHHARKKMREMLL